MGRFPDEDKELKDLWEGFFESSKGKPAKTALEEMGDVIPPKGLDIRLKMIAEEKPAFQFFPVFSPGIFSYRAALVTSFVFLLMLAGYFTPFGGPVKQSISNTDAFMQDSFSGDDDTLDDSLDDVEELIWAI
jgi:hypothetical protein